MTYFSIDDPEEAEERDDDVIKKIKEAIKRPSKVSFKLDDEPKKEMTKMRKLLYWLCGVENYINKDRREVNPPARKIDTSIDQTSLAKNICDVNAIIAIAVCGFMYAFFNKFSKY